MTSTRIAFAFAACLATSAALAAPPVAPVRPVTDTYFGTPVVDPYRYLEDLQSPEVQGWMRGQAEYTRSQLDAVPGRAALLARIHQLANTDARRGGFIQRGQRWFYQLLEPGAQQPRLYYRDGLSGEEHLLVDAAAMDAGAGTHYALDYYVPSWDGKRLAYGLSKGGSEASVLHVLEVDTGKALGESIERAHDGRIAWLDDNASFYYMRFNAPTPGMPASERDYNARTYFHRFGTNLAGDGDAVVFGRGVAQGLDVPEGQGTFLFTAPGSRYAVAAANHNLDDNPSTFYVAPLAAIKGAATPWKRFAEVGDGITVVELHGDTLYYLTSDGAPRFRLMATPLAKPDVHHARTIVPEGSGVLTDFSIAADGIYYRVREGSGATLHRVGFDGQGARAVPVPFTGNLFGPITDAGQPGTLFNLQDWVHPPQLYAYDPATGESRNTGLLPASKIDTSMLASEEVMVTSWDGTRVPLSILHRKDVRLDGSAPAIINGYGAYGIVIEAGFSANLVAWLERGGVYAYAHVRGGGELGDDWHMGGFKRTKPNTWLDFIACSQYLVDKGYTSSARLAGTGTSAGGILIGNAMSARPDLYRAIIDRVGMSDTLRSETEPNGPPNVSEFGSVKDEDGFHGLYAMSAYAHVRDGVDYPAVLFTTGANDPRVAPWHMMKMAARTQAATRSGRPVLLRIDYDAGHGMGSNRSQAEQQLADEWSFVLWQVGDPAFQPAQAGVAATPLDCAALAHRAFPDTRIDAAEAVAAGAFQPPASAMPGPPPADYSKLPAFCRVTGSLHPSADSDIRFEVWLPATGWNGKFVQVGNGGAAGSLVHSSLAGPLAQGYAVAHNDTGHVGGGADFAWAVGHPEKVTDYAWRSQHALTIAGKAITEARYGEAPKRSYWLGCSTGGRQGLKEAQRFPDDYDGIVAGAPASNFMRLMVFSMIQNQAMNTPGALTPAKAALLHEAAIAACDKADGVVDRVIARPMQCRFDPASLQCREGGPAQCLTASEVAAARRVYAGVVDRAGHELFPGPGVGSELLWPMGGSMQFDIGTNAYRALIARDATWSNSALDPEADVARAEKVDGGEIVAMDPDLRPFFARGGKLLSYHGTYDGLIPWRNSVNYYEAARAKSGTAASDAGMRLFLVPGMEHCAGGEGPYDVDWLGTLDRWVESGHAPAQLVGSHPPFQFTMDGSPPQPRTPYTRPLCAYPAEARYGGKGDVHEAKNWECVTPR